MSHPASPCRSAVPLLTPVQLAHGLEQPPHTPWPLPRQTQFLSFRTAPPFLTLVQPTPTPHPLLTLVQLANGPKQPHARCKV